jgi:hypothetical protein
MVLRKVLVVAAVMSLLGGGIIAGQAASTASPKFHDTTITATHGAKTLLVQSKRDALTFTNTTFSNLTAASITVPATGNFRIVARLFAESNCAAASWCTAEILIDGVEANPKVGSDFAIDSPGGNTYRSISMERTSDVIVGSGVVRTVVVDVEIALIGSGSWRLDDWSVSAELWKV